MGWGVTGLGPDRSGHPFGRHRRAGIERSRRRSVYWLSKTDGGAYNHADERSARATNFAAPTYRDRREHPDSSVPSGVSDLVFGEGLSHQIIKVVRDYRLPTGHQHASGHLL